jgi:hypothetical protein
MQRGFKTRAAFFTFAAKGAMCPAFVSAAPSQPPPNPTRSPCRVVIISSRRGEQLQHQQVTSVRSTLHCKSRLLLCTSKCLARVPSSICLAKPDNDLHNATTIALPNRHTTDGRSELHLPAGQTTVRPADMDRCRRYLEIALA